MGEIGRCWSKGTKLQLHKMNKSRDLMYSMMPIVNNIVLLYWKYGKSKLQVNS